MNEVKQYILRILVALSQLSNAILGGNPNELLSARAYRTNNTLLIKLIDLLFFFDKDHCKTSFLFELENEQLPEYKALTNRD